MRQPDAVIRPADIDLRFAPVRSAATVERVVEGDLLLLDPNSGSTHVLNATGRVFWSGLDGQTSLQDLTEDLADALGVPADDLTAPVLEWARALAHRGLFEGVAPSEADLLGISATVPAGEPLPPIAGEPLDGDETARTPAVRGRRTVLVNWSFDCGYCVGMLDLLEQARPALEAQGWGLALLVSEGRADVEPPARSSGLADVVVLTGANAEDKPFSGLGTPVAYVVDGDGIVIEPLSFGGDEVAATVRRLAGLASAAVGHRDATEGPEAENSVAEAGGPRYLALPPSAGVCAPSGSKPARTWTDVDTFLIGDLVVGIRAASPRAGQLVRRLLAGLAYDSEHRQPNYSVVLPDPEDAASRELNLLLFGDHVVARSRSARRIIDALLAYLSSHVTPEEPGVWRVTSFPVVKDGRAVLLPDELRSNLAQVQPRLSKAGLSMVDLPAAIIDTRTSELVVPPLTVPHDADVANGLGPSRVRGTELPPVPPGRYPLSAWLFPDAGPEVRVPATSLALACAAIDRPKDEALLTEVEKFLDRLPVAFGTDGGALIAAAAESVRER